MQNILESLNALFSQTLHSFIPMFTSSLLTVSFLSSFPSNSLRIFIWLVLVGIQISEGMKNIEITNISHITARAIPGELPLFTFQRNIFTRNETKLPNAGPTAEPSQYKPSRKTKFLPRLFSITCKTTWPRSTAIIPPLASPLIDLPKRGKYGLMLTLYNSK